MREGDPSRATGMVGQGVLRQLPIAFYFQPIWNDRSPPLFVCSVALTSLAERRFLSRGTRNQSSETHIAPPWD
jgi:hypothetical protein